MTSKIRVLNENTINKIAAGEVVENPASVVKELIENSLDAGAWEITIEIKSGGKQLIRVTDDGCGMSNDDALLCFERHATSKIQRLEDLEKIASMGFRGEALPSIASVSKLTLVTCPKTETKGPSAATMVIVEGGRMMKHCSAARSSGTTIEIKSLFFNVPARKKFQKSIQQDTTDVLKVVTLQALANPNIKLTLIGHHQTLLSAPAFGDISFQEALKRRTKTVLGADFLNNLCPVEATEGDYSLTGFIGKPFFTRNNRTGQYLFLNQRPVFSPAISSAILQGYGTAIASQRYPVRLTLEHAGSCCRCECAPPKA